MSRFPPFPSFSCHVSLARWPGADGGHPDDASGNTISRDSSCTCLSGPHPYPSSHSFVRSNPTWSVLLLLIFRYNFEDLILQFGKRPKPHTALHYTHELITTFGLIHTLNSDTKQLEAELCGTTSFRDHRIPPTPSSTPSSIFFDYDYLHTGL